MLAPRAARLALLSLSTITALGCGATATDARAVPVVGRPVARPGADRVALAEVDASRPRDLALLLRIRSAEEAIDAASLATGTPLSLLLEVARNLQEAPVLGAVELADPIDLAVVVPPGLAVAGPDDPEAMPLVAAAFSVASRSRLVESFPGAVVTPDRRDGSTRIATDEVVCSVPPGPAKVRAVCGTTDEAVRRLGPWLTATLPGEPLPAEDVHLALFAEPARGAIRQLVATELRSEAADVREELEQLGVSDAELLAIPDVVLDEMEALADDAERLELAFDLDGRSRTATARATARFRGSSAWITRVLADPAARRGPPPAIFWRAPKDADSASWALASSPEHFAPVRRALSKAVSLAMSRAGMTPDETAAVVGAIDGFPSYGGPWASAQGSLPWKAPPKGGVTPQNAVADMRAQARAVLGWGVAIVETPSTPWTSWVGQVETAWKKVIAGARRSFAGDEALAEAPELRVVRAPGGYPRGSVALDVVVRIDSELAWSSSPRLTPDADGLTPPHPPGARARGTMTLRFVVVPDGDRTLLGWSMDDAVLRARVRSMVASAPASGTIASREDLKALARPGTGGGFFSLRPWVDLTLEAAAGSADEEAVELVREAVERLPNRGATPVLTFSDGTSGPAPSLSVELVVQEGSIEDLRALGQFVVSKGLEGFMSGAADEVLTGPIRLQPPSSGSAPPSPAPATPPLPPPPPLPGPQGP